MPTHPKNNFFIRRYTQVAAWGEHPRLLETGAPFTVCILESLHSTLKLYGLSSLFQTQAVREGLSPVT